MTTADLLVINKVDLAPLVGADLAVMTTDAHRVRDGLPVITQSLVADPAATEVSDWVLAQVAAARRQQGGFADVERQDGHLADVPPTAPSWLAGTARGAYRSAPLIREVVADYPQFGSWTDDGYPDMLTLRTCQPFEIVVDSGRARASRSSRASGSASPTSPRC